MNVAIVILWIIWSLLFLAWPADLVVALLQDPEQISRPDRQFVTILAVVGFISLCLSFFLRWLVFRFLIHPDRIQLASPWAITLTTVGSLLIWGLTKSVEIYGLTLYFTSHSLAYYLPFWVPSLLIMIFHNPFLLDPRRRVTREKTAEDGVSILPGKNRN